MTRILFDCDPGIDDAKAILFALNSDDLVLEGITTVTGNVGVDVDTTNVLRILELTGTTCIPVAK